MGPKKNTNILLCSSWSQWKDAQAVFQANATNINEHTCIKIRGRSILRIRFEDEFARHLLDIHRRCCETCPPPGGRDPENQSRPSAGASVGAQCQGRGLDSQPSSPPCISVIHVATQTDSEATRNPMSRSGLSLPMAPSIKHEVKKEGYCLDEQASSLPASRSDNAEMSDGMHASVGSTPNSHSTGLSQAAPGITSDAGLPAPVSTSPPTPDGFETPTSINLSSESSQIPTGIGESVPVFAAFRSSDESQVKTPKGISDCRPSMPQQTTGGMASSTSISCVHVRSIEMLQPSAILTSLQLHGDLSELDNKVEIAGRGPAPEPGSLVPDSLVPSTSLLPDSLGSNTSLAPESPVSNSIVCNSLSPASLVSEECTCPEIEKTLPGPENKESDDSALVKNVRSLSNTNEDLLTVVQFVEKIEAGPDGSVDSSAAEKHSSGTRRGERETPNGPVEESENESPMEGMEGVSDDDMETQETSQQRPTGGKETAQKIQRQAVTWSKERDSSRSAIEKGSTSGDNIIQLLLECEAGSNQDEMQGGAGPVEARLVEEQRGGGEGGGREGSEGGREELEEAAPVKERLEDEQRGGGEGGEGLEGGREELEEAATEGRSESGEPDIEHGAQSTGEGNGQGEEQAEGESRKKEKQLGRRERMCALCKTKQLFLSKHLVRVHKVENKEIRRKYCMAAREVVPITRIRGPPPKHPRKRFSCPWCCTKGILRLDVHLVDIHKMKRDKTLRALLRSWKDREEREIPEEEIPEKPHKNTTGNKEKKPEGRIDRVCGLCNAKTQTLSRHLERKHKLYGNAKWEYIYKARESVPIQRKRTIEKGCVREGKDCPYCPAKRLTKITDHILRKHPTCYQPRKRTDIGGEQERELEGRKAEGGGREEEGEEELDGGLGDVELEEEELGEEGVKEQEGRKGDVESQSEEGDSQEEELEGNKQDQDPASRGPEETGPKKRVRNEASKKYNRWERLCVICNESQLQLGHHLTRVHKITDINARREFLMDAREKVPITRSRGAPPSGPLSGPLKRRFSCPLCDVKGILRLDNHLVDTHKMRRDETMRVLLRSWKDREEREIPEKPYTNSTGNVEMKERLTFYQVFERFMAARLGTAETAQTTAQLNRRRVQEWMRQAGSITSLFRINDFIDAYSALQREKRQQPGVMQEYTASMKDLCEFLAADDKQRRLMRLNKWQIRRIMLKVNEYSDGLRKRLESGGLVPSDRITGNGLNLIKEPGLSACRSTESHPGSSGKGPTSIPPATPEGGLNCNHPGSSNLPPNMNTQPGSTENGPTCSLLASPGNEPSYSQNGLASKQPESLNTLDTFSYPLREDSGPTCNQSEPFNPRTTNIRPGSSHNGRTFSQLGSSGNGSTCNQSDWSNPESTHNESTNSQPGSAESTPTVNQPRPSNPEPSFVQAEYGINRQPECGTSNGQPGLSECGPDDTEPEPTEDEPMFTELGLSPSDLRFNESEESSSEAEALLSSADPAPIHNEPGALNIVPSYPQSKSLGAGPNYCQSGSSNKGSNYKEPRLSEHGPSQNLPVSSETESSFNQARLSEHQNPNCTELRSLSCGQSCNRPGRSECGPSDVGYSHTQPKVSTCDLSYSQSAWETVTSPPFSDLGSILAQLGDSLGGSVHTQPGPADIGPGFIPIGPSDPRPTFTELEPVGHGTDLNVQRSSDPQLTARGLGTSSTGLRCHHPVPSEFGPGSNETGPSTPGPMYTQLEPLRQNYTAQRPSTSGLSNNLPVSPGSATLSKSSRNKPGQSDLALGYQSYYQRWLSSNGRRNKHLSAEETVAPIPSSDQGLSSNPPVSSDTEPPDPEANDSQQGPSDHRSVSTQPRPSSCETATASSSSADGPHPNQLGPPNHQPDCHHGPRPSSYRPSNGVSTAQETLASFQSSGHSPSCRKPGPSGNRRPDTRQVPSAGHTEVVSSTSDPQPSSYQPVADPIIKVRKRRLLTSSDEEVMVTEVMEARRKKDTRKLQRHRRFRDITDAAYGNLGATLKAKLSSKQFYDKCRHMGLSKD